MRAALFKAWVRNQLRGYRYPRLRTVMNSAPLPRDEHGCFFCAGAWEVDNGENWCRCCGRGHPDFPYTPAKEIEMKNVVRVCPTSNGFIVCVDVGPNNQLPADAVVVVETANKNVDDVKRQVGDAVMSLTQKILGEQPAAPAQPMHVAPAPAPQQ